MRNGQNSHYLIDTTDKTNCFHRVLLVIILKLIIFMKKILKLLFFWSIVFSDEISAQAPRHPIQIHNGITLTVSLDEIQSSLKIGKDIVLECNENFRIAIKKVAFSPNGNVCAVIINHAKSRQYAGIQVCRKSKGGWIKDESLVLQKLPNSYREISELGAISDDASLLLAQFTIIIPFEDIKRVTNEWETWSTKGEFKNRGLAIQKNAH